MSQLFFRCASRQNKFIRNAKLAYTLPKNPGCMCIMTIYDFVKCFDNGTNTNKNSGMLNTIVRTINDDDRHANRYNALYNEKFMDLYGCSFHGDMYLGKTTRVCDDSKPIHMYVTMTEDTPPEFNMKRALVHMKRMYPKIYIYFLMHHMVTTEITTTMSDTGIVSNLPIYGLFGHNTILQFKNNSSKEKYIKAVRSMYEQTNQTSNFYYVDGYEFAMDTYGAFSNIMLTCDSFRKYHLFIDNFDDILFYDTDCFAREIVEYLSRHPNICPHFLIANNYAPYIDSFRDYIATSTLFEC